MKTKSFLYLIVIMVIAMLMMVACGPKETTPQVTDEPVEEPLKSQIDKTAARTRIQKAFDEGKISEAQYNHNMDKFKD